MTGAVDQYTVAFIFKPKTYKTAARLDITKRNLGLSIFQYWTMCLREKDLI